MKLADRLAPDEITELQNVMRNEPLPPRAVLSPSALMALLGKGLIRLEDRHWWVDWKNINGNLQD